MKTFPRLLFIVLLVLPALSFAEQPSFKIGATLALTGKVAIVGRSEQQGLQLAVEEVNAAGGVNGRKLELIVEDNGGDPKTALAGVNKMIDSDHIDVLFSSFTHITQAVKDRFAKTGNVMLYAAILGDIAKANSRFFCDWANPDSQGASMIEALRRTGKKTAAFLTEEGEACATLERSLDSAADAAQIKIVARDSYQPGETDFKPLLLRLAAKKPEAFLFCAWRDAGVITTQAKAIGLERIPVVHMLAPFVADSDTPQVRKLYEENKTISIWLGFVEGSMNEKQKEFFAKLKQSFGTAPRMEAALAHDDVMILAEALKACPSPSDAACISQNLSHISYDGVAGRLQFNEDRRSTRSDLLIEVKNGVWQSAFETPEK